MVQFIDLGLADYKETWAKQEIFFNALLAHKSNPNEHPKAEQALIFCEHPHVYTLGKSGDEQNLLVNYIELQAKDATFVKTNRGGDITYHGPGQLVGYPVLDLESYDIGVKDYIYNIEEAIMLSMKDYGIAAKRLDGAIGVWIDVKKGEVDRKICAIGVKVSRYVSMHGFALNINTD
ncbi:MAG: lipoyl(octanoyl) transferase, partial [Paludibacter sp.]